MCFLTYQFFSHVPHGETKSSNMENDVADVIEIAASTNNEGKEEDNIPVELVDEEERFHAGCRDGEPVIIRF